MSSRFSLFIAYSCLLLATACTQRVAMHDHPPHDSSVNALDWAGTYRGDLPCADCAGIEVILTLNADLSWHMQMLYDNGGITRFEREGTFSWEADGNHIRLHGISDAPNRYKVEENRLVKLDSQGNRIEGALADSYILTRMDIAAPVVASLFDVRWRMLEMTGAKPAVAEARLPYIHFTPETRSIAGFSGCNQFSGTYELLPGNRLRFSQMVSTMMACADMSIETEMLRLLSTVDNYSLSNNRLSLNRARMAPLMVFQATPLP